MMVGMRSGQGREWRATVLPLGQLRCWGVREMFSVTSRPVSVLTVEPLPVGLIASHGLALLVKGAKNGSSGIWGAARQTEYSRT